MPRLVEGKCQCTFPYTGSQCDQCESGYKASKDNKSLTICSIDKKACTAELCNNHGKCIQDNNSTGLLKCQCSENYKGKFCDKCANKKFAYPDCDSEDISSDLYSKDKKLPEYMLRSKYNTDGYELIE